MIDPAIAKVTGYLRDAYDRNAQDTSYSVPVYRLVVDGNDIAHKISPRLISLHLTDNPGLEADQLTLTLSDHDGLLAIPPLGAVIRVWLGWSDTGLVEKGTYTVDETEHSGPPDVLSIRARSADLRHGLKTKKERSWSNKTLGAVLEEIAAGNDLKAVINEQLAAVVIEQLDQANESDVNLISRLGEEFDAVVAIKAGCLLCLPAGGGKSASGLDLPHITLTRADGDQHRYLQVDRDSYDGVKAYYYDVNSAEKREVTAGGGENLKELRHTYSGREAALRAARGEWCRTLRGSESMSYFLVRGRADLTPEMFYTLVGFKSEFARPIWHSAGVEHSIEPHIGFHTTLQLRTESAVL